MRYCFFPDRCGWALVDQVGPTPDKCEVGPAWCGPDRVLGIRTDMAMSLSDRWFRVEWGDGLAGWLSLIEE